VIRSEVWKKGKRNAVSAGASRWTNYEGEGGDDNGLNVSIKLRTEDVSFDTIEDLITALAV
jgi:hypothetical protein